ncbi:MAG: toll/interleukin-1 receptor domain-containing protein [Firmicutes bacterium]|nr:toll/interleukin-1 receptor domain-containing protein [Bacillota bacterium]
MVYKYDVFISFDSSEEKTAREFYNNLTKIGYSVFYYPVTRVSGKSNNFRTQEETALKETHFFLLLCNGNSFTSEEVNYECNYFAQRQTADHVFIFEAHGFKEIHIPKIDGWKQCFRCGDVTQQINLIKEKIPLSHNNKEVIVRQLEVSTLQIFINEKIIKIPVNYEDFKKLMVENNAPCFIWRNNEYNINSLNSESFNYLIGKIEYNQLLTKQLIEAISKNSKEIAEKFYNQAILTPNWEFHPRIFGKAKEIISYSFVSVVGKQLSRLMAIGNEPLEDEKNMEDKSKRYKEQCYQIMKYTIELLSFTFLSKLWDDVNMGAIQLTPKEKIMISNRINIAFDPPIENKIDFLNGLIKIYLDNENKTSMPISEIINNYSTMLPQGNVYQSCIALKGLTQDEATIFNCYKAENHLATFLTHFSFLVKYRMISMKKIGYRQIRYKFPNYLHQYTALGVANKTHTDVEKLNYAENAVFTDAVLLYKGDDYKDCINLFPLVVDYNALTLEQGAKICFFSSQQIGEDNLEYINLEDNSIVELEKKDIIKQKADINDIFLSENDIKIFNIDCVLDVFSEMQKLFISDIDDFNNL